METLWRDLRYGVRTLSKNPGITLIAVISLALGIGANAAVFSLVDTLLLRPLPVFEPHRLVAFGTRDHHGDYPHGVSYRDFLDYRDQNTAFSGLTAFMPVQLAFSNSGQNSEALLGYMVSGNHFSVLGVQSVLGRAFLPEEDRTPDTHAVAVISYGLWERRFGADPNVIGKSVNLNSHPFAIIGVAPKEFRGVEVIAAPEIWVPAMMQSVLLPNSPNLLEERDSHAFRVWGRLKDDLPMEQAQAAINTQAQGLAEAYPATNQGVRVQLFPQWEARFEPGTGAALATASALLMGLVGLVLLIACANLANLLLARATVRGKEMALRQALGANRWQLIRQLLTESLLLAFLGALVSLVLATWAIEGLRSVKPGGGLPLNLDVQLDGRVLLFTAAIALVAAILFGLAPALRTSKINLVSALKGEESVLGQKTRRLGLRNALVIAQIAMSLVLMISAALFLQSLGKAEQMDLGIRSQHTVMGSVNLSLNGYDQTRGQAFYRDAVERIRTLPGVESVGLARFVPLDFSVGGHDVIIEGREVTTESEKVGIMSSVVSADYFRAIGTPVIRGREFGEQDDRNHQLVAIVNATMARQYWPDQEAIGKRFRLASRTAPPIEIVGIAKDGKYRQYFEAPQPYFYLPFLQNYRADMTLVIETQADAATLIAGLRREVAALDANLPLTGVMSIEEFLQGRTFLGTQLISSLLGIFGLIGLMLAAIGIFGVMSYFVGRRTREIGIRIALGATRSDVLKLVLGQGMLMTVIGIGIGLAGALALSRLTASLLYGISASDPLTFLFIALVFAAISLLACYLPAQRALKVDPMVALRYE